MILYLVIFYLINLSWGQDNSVNEWKEYIKLFPDLAQSNFIDDANITKYENITAVIGSPVILDNRDVIIGYQNIYSYARPPSLKNEGRIATRHDEYFIANKDIVCTDVIVVQQQTQLLSNLSVLLPYRSIAIIDCLNPNNDPPSTSLKSSIKTLKLHQLERRARIVHATLLMPNLEFMIGNKRVRVEGLRDSVNIIASLDFFINIRDKEAKLAWGQFSYRNDRYREMFSAYALTLPFAQNILLQVVPLASKLDSSSYPTEQDMKLYAAYTDLFYCGERFCSGGPMTGKSGTPYAFQREDYYNNAIKGINQLMTKLNTYVSLIMRTLVNQKSQFTNHIQNTGLFMISGQCYVSETAEVFGKKIQNQLPHELGHTYNLPDYSGHGTPDDKLLSYALNTDHTLLVPWISNNYESYRGSMNSGYGDSTFQYYTRLNRYSSLLAYDSVTRDRDDLPETFWNNLNNTNMRSLMITRHNIEYFGFVINAYAPLTPLLSTPPGGSYVVIRRFLCTNELDVKYISNVERFVLPYEWIADREASIVITYNGNTKRLYLTDEGRDLPLPYSGIYPSLFN